MNGAPKLRVPLTDGRGEIGALELGARKSGEPYSDADCQTLTRNVARVARALALSHGEAEKNQARA